MSGLVVGAVLSLGSAAWVIAPLVRGRTGAAADAPAGDAVAPRVDEEVLARCPACGAPPEADARFCSNCGRAIASKPGVSPASS